MSATRPDAGAVRAEAGNAASEARTPRVGVVVLTYNGWEHTHACLRSLEAVDYAAMTVIVVDNASSDDTPRRVAAEFPDVVVLEQGENRGFTGGNNAGIRWCLEHGMDAVLILNNDTEVEPDFLRRLVDRLDDADVVTPRIRPTRPGGPADEGIGWFDWRRGIVRPGAHPVARRPGDPPTRIASGCCLLCSRAVLERVGGFDDDFFLYFEDVDLVVRAQEAGFTLADVPEAVVHHHGSASTGGVPVSPVTLYYNTRNRLHLMRKHGRIGPGFIAYFAATRLAWAARYAARGQWPLLRSMVRGVRDGVAGRMARADHAW